MPGQEEGNVTYVTENGAGVLARTPVEMVDALRRLIKPGSQVLQEQLESARRLSRPRASFEIVGHILSYLPAPGEMGIWEQSEPSAAAYVRRSLRPAVLRTSGRKFPLRVAVAAPGRLRNNLARLGVLRRPTTRTTGPLDTRTVSRRLPQLIGRSSTRDQK